MILYKGLNILWQRLANTIFLLHIGFISFILAAPILIAIGLFADWQIIENPLLRHLHMIAVSIVLIEVVLNRPCPLTVWENMCRIRAGMPPYTDTFFGYWVRKVLRIQFKPWMFNVSFAALGALSVVEYVIYCLN